MSGSSNKNKKYFTVFIIAVLVLALALGSIMVVFKVIYPTRYKEYVLKYSEVYGIDPYLVFSMIKAESNFDPDALSGRNARGLMQITVTTGEWIAKNLEVKDFSVNDLFEPETNIRFGCWYINYLESKEFNNAKFIYDTDDESKWNLIIMSYNGGSSNVKKWVKSNGSSSLTYNQIPFKETRNYLKRVKDYKAMYKRLYSRIV